MKRIIIASVAALLAAPAIAQTTTTLQEVTTKGIVMDAGGFTIDVAYTPDGKFTAMDGAVTGTWRIDGEKLCTTSNFNPAEECTVYPAGKKSGDSFEMTGAQGTATITIK
jgi:hypothetical protein